MLTPFERRQVFVGGLGKWRAQTTKRESVGVFGVFFCANVVIGVRWNQHNSQHRPERIANNLLNKNKKRN